MSLSYFIKPTRYTRLPYLLLGMLLLSACEQEIGELTEYEEPRLVVNALITAQADSQLVHLRMTGFTQTAYVDNAEVEIRHNGELFYQYVAMGDPANVLPSTDFHPGDQIAIDVRKDGHHAQAVSVVPNPIIITGIDTLSVNAKRHKWSTGYEPHTRYMVHLKLAENVNQNEMQYFRVEVRKEIHTVSGGVRTQKSRYLRRRFPVSISGRHSTASWNGIRTICIAYAECGQCAVVNRSLFSIW